LSGSLFIKNRQRTIPVNVRHLRWLTRDLLRELLGIDDFDLAVYVVRAPEMARLNETHLQHEGPTDVITFDYSNPVAADVRRLSIPGKKLEPPHVGCYPSVHGEIFVCIDEAVSQARTFRTTWQSELVRYVIHGVLHLRGYDDKRPADRRKMKREEDRLLAAIGRSFPMAKVAGKRPHAKGATNAKVKE